MTSLIVKTKKPPYRPYSYKDKKFLQFYKEHKEELFKIINRIERTGVAYVEPKSYHLIYYLKYLGYNVTV